MEKGIEGISLKAVQKCAEWLAYCLKIGYDKKDLDELEKLWWKWKRDKMGNLIQPLQEVNPQTINKNK